MKTKEVARVKTDRQSEERGTAKKEKVKREERWKKSNEREWRKKKSEEEGRVKSDQGLRDKATVKTVREYRDRKCIERGRVKSKALERGKSEVLRKRRRTEDCSLKWSGKGGAVKSERGRQQGNNKVATKSIWAAHFACNIYIYKHTQTSVLMCTSVWVCMCVCVYVCHVCACACVLCVLAEAWIKLTLQKSDWRKLMENMKMCSEQTNKQNRHKTVAAGATTTTAIKNRWKSFTN